jgi:hypothetical protein
MKERTKIINPTLSHCVEIVDYIWTIKKCQKLATVNSAIEFFEKSKMYSKTAIDFLAFHEVIIIEKDTIELPSDVLASLDGTKKTILAVLKKKILKFQPLVEYMIFCANGKKTNDAAKFVKAIYCISQETEQIIAIFSNWIKYLGFAISEFKATNNVLNEAALNSDISKTIQVIAILKDKFGDYFNQLDKNVLDDLSEALKCYEDNPKKAVNDTGRALEDFLRLNFAAGIDTKECAGIVQIVNLLANQKMISSKQNGVVLGLGNIRSMGDAHGVDKNYTERWSIRKSSALLYIEMVIATINSLLVFKQDQSLVF